MKYDKEGWPCFVQIKENKVIKQIKTKEEISIFIKKHLESVGQLDRLKEKTEKINSSTIKSLEIIKKSDIPRKYLANTEINDNMIEQDKVTLFGEKINELIKLKNEEEARKLIECLLDFMISFWNYKIHENTYKFYSFYGIDKNKLLISLISLYPLDVNIFYLKVL